MKVKLFLKSLLYIGYKNLLKSPHLLNLPNYRSHGAGRDIVKVGMIRFEAQAHDKRVIASPRHNVKALFAQLFIEFLCTQGVIPLTLAPPLISCPYLG